MNASHPSDREYEPGEMEEITVSPRKIPSVASLFHVLWLRKWVALGAWLVLAIPAGVVLSIVDLPKSYSAATVLRFPQVVGAQTNVMRDVAITQGESIISIFNSYQVLEAVVRKMGLRLRITSDQIFHREVFASLKYGENLAPGLYTLTLGRDRTATLFYKPANARSDYTLSQGPVIENKLSVPGLEMEFAPRAFQDFSGVPIDLYLRTLERTITSLKKSLTARALGPSNFEIRVKDRDPWLVADIVNTLREQFLEVYYGTTEVQDVGILVQMEKDLELSKQRLETSQNDLSRFYAEHPELATKDAAPQGDNLAYLESRQGIETLQQRRKRVVEAMAAREAGAAPEKDFYWASELLAAMSEAGEPKANILRSSLQEMNGRQTAYQGTLGPGHPKIKEVEAEKEEIYRQIGEAESSLVRRMDAEISDLKLRMASAMPRGPARPAVRVQLELERMSNVNHNNQNIYDRLLESYNRAKLVTGSEFFKVTVVDQARPALFEPPSLKARLLIAVAAVFALLLIVPGLFLAWPLIIIRLFTKDDVRRLLGLRLLGVVIHKKLKAAPKRKAGGGGKRPGEGGGDPAEPCDPLLLFYGSGYRLEDLEAYRIIREECENTFRKASEPGKLCVMVTSCNPNEGKSTCSANLAMTFARKGKRTLLVDADFRLGRVADIFNVKVSTGLDEVLDQPDMSSAQFLSTATLVFQNTMQRNLVVAPRKSPNPNAGEMASSDRFKAFIRMAREQFDVVVIDTPPVLITPEPLSLAELTHGVVFVCRSGRTVASEAREAIETLRERRVQVAAILNAVHSTPFQQSRYRKYSYYYQVQPKPGDQEE